MTFFFRGGNKLTTKSDATSYQPVSQRMLIYNNNWHITFFSPHILESAKKKQPVPLDNSNSVKLFFNSTFFCIFFFSAMWDTYTYSHTFSLPRPWFVCHSLYICIGYKSFLIVRDRQPPTCMYSFPLRVHQRVKYTNVRVVQLFWTFFRPYANSDGIYRHSNAAAPPWPVQLRPVTQEGKLRLST